MHFSLDFECVGNYSQVLFGFPNTFFQIALPLWKSVVAKLLFLLGFSYTLLLSFVITYIKNIHMGGYSKILDISREIESERERESKRVRESFPL